MSVRVVTEDGDLEEQELAIAALKLCLYLKGSMREIRAVLAVDTYIMSTIRVDKNRLLIIT